MSLLYLYGRNQVRRLRIKLIIIGILILISYLWFLVEFTKAGNDVSFNRLNKQDQMVEPFIDDFTKPNLRNYSVQPKEKINI